MLAFARKQELQLETVDTIKLVRDMAEMLQRTIGAGVSVDTRFPLMLKSVHADPAQLQLVLLNLAVNARDAMPDGGRLVIAAREERVEQCGVLAPGNYVCLSVTDSGGGMDEATLARATEPFFTTKGVGSGTGLGLSMAHGFAEQCGGRLSLKSRVGEGTTAELWLPIAQDGVVPRADRGACDAAGGMERLVILAVDDDHLVLNNTAAMLEDSGHRVLLAASGRQALQMLADERVDLLITDYAMPEMTGAQLTDAVRKGWPELPVLMVSGYAELPDGAAIGVPRLAKPFRDDQLVRAVRQAVAVTRPGGRVLAFRAR